MLKQKRTVDIPWHPDFRDVSNLPDIKLVRTDFLLNSICVAIFLSAAIFFVVNFLNAKNFKDNNDLLKEVIEKERMANQKAFKQNKVFIKESKLVQTFNAFMHPSINPLTFILEISNLKNEKMIFSSVSYIEKSNPDAGSQKNKNKKISPKSYVFSIKGSIYGTYDESLGILNRYMASISSNSTIKSFVKSIEMASLKRDALIDLFTYQIDLTVDPEMTQKK